MRKQLARAKELFFRTMVAAVAMACGSEAGGSEAGGADGNSLELAVKLFRAASLHCLRAKFKIIEVNQ